MQKKGLAVVAVGGNALIKDKNHQTVPDQYQAAADTMAHIATMIEDGWDVVVTHGNGPQVGFILRRSELAAHELHEIPLDSRIDIFLFIDSIPSTANSQSQKSDSASNE